MASIQGKSTIKSKFDRMAGAAGRAMVGAVRECVGLQAQALRSGARQQGLGRVARAVGTSVKVRGEHVTGKAGIRKGRSKKGELSADALARLAEFGSKERQHKSGHRTGRMPATPFVRIAYQRTKRQCARVVRQAMVGIKGA